MSWEVERKYCRWMQSINVAGSHTGDTVETTVGTIVIPAKSMGPYGRVRIWSIWEGVGAGSHYFYTYFGTIAAGNWVGYYTLGAAVTVDARPITIWNKGATNAQSSTKWGFQFAPYHSVGGSYIVNMTVDTTQDVSVFFRVKNAVAGHTSYLHYGEVDGYYCVG